MAYIHLPQRWRVAPTRPVELTPRARDRAVAFVLPNGWGFYEILRRAALTPAGNSVLNYGQEGRAFFNAGGTGDKFDYDGGYSVSTTDFTIEVMARITAIASLQHVFGVTASLPAAGGGTNGDTRGILAFTGGTPPDIYFWGASADLDSNVPFRADGSMQHIFITATGGTMRFYRDGYQVASGSTPSLVTSVTRLSIGSRHASGSNSPTMRVFKGSIRNRALSPGEVADITAAPFSDFRPLQQRIYVNVAAAPAPTGVTPLVRGRFSLVGHHGMVQ